MKNSFILILLFCSANSFAQLAETIRSGRPGQAIGSYAVGAKVFQMQTGIDYGGLQNDVFNFSQNSFNPNTVLRFGLTEKIEINTGWAYQYEQYETPFISSERSGLSQSTIGTRINIIEANNYLPAVGIQVTMKLPILSPDYNVSFIAPRIMAIANQKLAEKLALTLNLGIDYNGVNAQPTGVYVANLSYAMTNKFGVFLENYGDFGQSFYNTFWDAGLSYLINNDLQLDVLGGLALNDDNMRYFLSVGVSWRFVAWHQSN